MSWPPPASPTGRKPCPTPSFDPGKRLALVAEPANEHDPNAVAIWNAERTLQLGYVPAAVAPELGGDEQAVSLWRVDGGLRVLIVPADAWVGLPSQTAELGSTAVAYEFKLPDLGEGLTEGEVARWLVTEGQELAEDDPLVEIQTDKTTVEIPSPAAGTVTRILVAEGEVVPVGTVLVVIGADGAEPAAAAPEPKAAAAAAAPRRESVDSTQARVQATPIVRRIAAELGVDLAQLSGTGPNGRITEADVRNAGGAETCVESDTSPRGAARARARSAPADRRAPDEGPPRGAGRDVRRGVRLHRRRPQAAAAARAQGGGGVARRVPGAERSPRGRRDRLPRPLRPRRRRADRRGTRRPRRPRLRLGLARGARDRGGAARRMPPAAGR